MFFLPVWVFLLMIKGLWLCLSLVCLCNIWRMSIKDRWCFALNEVPFSCVSYQRKSSSGSSSALIYKFAKLAWNLLQLQRTWWLSSNISIVKLCLPNDYSRFNYLTSYNPSFQSQVHTQNSSKSFSLSFPCAPPPPQIINVCTQKINPAESSSSLGV